MTLLGIDIGTTHCKAGLFGVDGTTLKIASRPMAVCRAPEGYAYFDAEAVWNIVADLIREVTAEYLGSVRAVGVASMAESGLLINRRTGEARSPILPWFEQSAQRQAEKIAAAEDALDFYVRSGLRGSYKCSLAKILWWRERDPAVTDGAAWLSVADFIAYRLTGAFGTDFSLAGRTGAFDIRRKAWDADWLARWGLSPSLFPPAQPSGVPVGQTSAEWIDLGIAQGTPLTVAGHDHLCAAFAAVATAPGEVFDSMGTAEVLTGAIPERELTQTDYDIGLLSGCHVARDHSYWLGALSASGGAVDWLRGLLGETPLSYDELAALVERANTGPTGILFFPYLLGSGAPHSDPQATGAWIGLTHRHTRADLAKAVLEGTAYEMELIRRAGERMTGQPITQLTAAGGGARNSHWLHIKADVSGCVIHVPAEADMTLLGAALAAGIGCGIYANEVEARAVVTQPHTTIEPDARRHERYHALFECYLELQAPLRRLSAIEKDNKLT